MRNRVYDKYKRGEISDEDIGQELERAMVEWENSDDDEKVGVTTYLGMTWKEYDYWTLYDAVPKPDTLK